MNNTTHSQARLLVVGVGGAGCNAVLRMAKRKLRGVDLLAINTDVQALTRTKDVATLAIGPNITGGMGSGGNPIVGRKAIKESHEQVSEMMAGSDLVFITAGMGGGTGTGAAATIADIARKQGALTIGVVTRPFSFEGPARRALAEVSLEVLQQKVDTLIAVDNDRLLSSLDGKASLDKAFQLADEVLRQGVQGISDIITAPGLINVDFADVRSITSHGGPSFMAMGEGRGRNAGSDAVQAALANPLFDTPLEGARGVLLNVTGGKDLTLRQVHKIADTIRDACNADANMVFGVVQEPKWCRRVSITLVATGLKSADDPASTKAIAKSAVNGQVPVTSAPEGSIATNGHARPTALGVQRLI